MPKRSRFRNRNCSSNPLRILPEKLITKYKSAWRKSRPVTRVNLRKTCLSVQRSKSAKRSDNMRSSLKMIMHRKKKYRKSNRSRVESSIIKSRSRSSKKILLKFQGLALARLRWSKTNKSRLNSTSADNNFNK